MLYWPCNYAASPGGWSYKEIGVTSSGPSATLLLPRLLSYSPAPNLASHARNLKSGKRAREKFVMRTVLFPPSPAPFLLSLSLSNKQNVYMHICTSLPVCVWSAAWDICRVAEFLASWLAGWEGVVTTACQAMGFDSRQNLRGEMDLELDPEPDPPMCLLYGLGQVNTFLCLSFPICKMEITIP